MSDSIKNDTGFAEILGSFTKAFAQFNNCSTVKSGLLQTEMLTHDLAHALSNKREELKSKSETARDELYKYIDRYAERKVLVEREFQKHEKSIKGLVKEKEPIVFGLPPCPQESPVRFYSHPLSDNSVEMMRVTPDGICRIHKDYCSDKHVLKYVKDVIVEQIMKINSSLVILPKFYIDFKYNNFAPCPILEVSVSFDNPGGIQHIVRKFYGTKSDHINRGDRFDIDLNNLAKYFSEEVNKIAREKHAPK